MISEMLLTSFPPNRSEWLDCYFNDWRSREGRSKVLLRGGSKGGRKERGECGFIGRLDFAAVNETRIGNKFRFLGRSAARDGAFLEHGCVAEEKPAVGGVDVLGDGELKIQYLTRFG